MLEHGRRLFGRRLFGREREEVEQAGLGFGAGRVLNCSGLRGAGGPGGAGTGGPPTAGLGQPASSTAYRRGGDGPSSGAQLRLTTGAFLPLRAARKRSRCCFATWAGTSKVRKRRSNSAAGAKGRRGRCGVVGCLVCFCVSSWWWTCATLCMCVCVVAGGGSCCSSLEQRGSAACSPKLHQNWQPAGGAVWGCTYTTSTLLRRRRGAATRPRILSHVWLCGGGG